MLPPDIIFQKLKSTKYGFGWGFAPDPTGNAHSAPPDPIAGFKESKRKKRNRKKGRG